MAKDEQTKPQGDEKAADEKTSPGHNIFATQDYYTQRNIDRRTEIERDVRGARARTGSGGKEQEAPLNATILQRGNRRRPYGRRRFLMCRRWGFGLLL